MTRLVAAAQNALLDKLELKIKQFAQLEAIVQRERVELAKGRRELFLERLAWSKKVHDLTAGVGAARLDDDTGNPDFRVGGGITATDSVEIPADLKTFEV